MIRSPRAANSPALRAALVPRGSSKRSTRTRDESQTSSSRVPSARRRRRGVVDADDFVRQDELIELSFELRHEMSNRVGRVPLRDQHGVMNHSDAPAQDSQSFGNPRRAKYLTKTDTR